jgi:hypothetical protein
MRFAVACAFVLLVKVVPAQPGESPEDLYQRVRQRVLDDVSRLPNFTCVQTITRRTYGTVPKKRPPRCDKILRDRNIDKRNLPLLLWDRLRLDVAIADKHEVYSWVGDAKFEENDLRQLVGGGQTVTGDFASLFQSVFEDHPKMRFEREQKIGGRRLFEYSYETPVESSHYQLKVSFLQFTIGYQGSVFLDPKTNDAVRVTARSALLPEQTGYCEVTRELDYSRLPIGTGYALIPQRASSRAIDSDGLVIVYASDYSSCREYVGESALRFDDTEKSKPPVAPGGTSPVSNIASVINSPFPPGLAFDCTIVTPIDSDTAATGDPFEAVLRTSLSDASGKVLAPAGARIHGRMMAFKKHPASAIGKESYEIGMQLRSIDLGGQRVPLAATLVDESRSKRASIRLDVHPKTGTLIFYEKKVHLNSLDTKWLTAISATGVRVTLF